MTECEIRESIYEELNGERMMDGITKAEMQSCLDDMEAWLETAKIGDVYMACGNEYELSSDYLIKVWRSSIERESGEPIEMSPMSSVDNIELVKAEVEQYDIESSGCIEIVDLDIEEPIWHYEKGQWNEV